jgi:hypothetical protein
VTTGVGDECLVLLVVMLLAMVVLVVVSLVS